MALKETDYLAEDEINKKVNRIVLNYCEGTVSEGDKLLSISLASTSGSTVNLAEVAKTYNIVLFFYPGNGIGLEYPELIGCTAEACKFSSKVEEFDNLNCKIFGVSTQSAKQQLNFKNDQKLAFDCLSDEKGKLINMLDIPVWQLKGKNDVHFSSRSTVIVAKGGIIETILMNIPLASIESHVGEVFKKLQDMSHSKENHRRKFA